MSTLDSYSQKRASESDAHNMNKRKRTEAPQSTNPLKNGISQCFHLVTTSLYVSLAPCHINNPINGIKAQHLDPLVMTYFNKANGVVLSYSNIRVSKSNKPSDSNDTGMVARVSDSSPFVFMWIAVDFLVWRPQVGDILEGWAYMQTASHIGLLVHDTFNASIKKFNIPQDWQFVPSQADETETAGGNEGSFKSFGYWTDENGAKIDGKLQFTVKAIHSAGRVVSVEGSLVSPGSESDTKPVEPASNNNTHKKFDDDNDDDDVLPVPQEETEKLPAYTNSDNEVEEDGEVLNKDSSDEDEVESD